MAGPDVDESDALRLVRCYEGDVKKVGTYLQADFAWRKQVRPEAATQADIPSALASGCIRFLPGLSTTGERCKPLCVV